jgi:hypothetical protein
MDGRQPLFEGGTPARTDQTDEDDNGDSRMTFDRRRSELEARSLRRLDLPRVYHENQIAELDAHNLKNLPLVMQTQPLGTQTQRLLYQTQSLGRQTQPLLSQTQPLVARTQPLLLRPQ